MIRISITFQKALDDETESAKEEQLEVRTFL